MQPTTKNNCGILLLGDSIRMGYCGFVREAMKEKADIFWPEDNCMFAHYTLRFLYEWRHIVPDPAQIDVVHWNNGLWDVQRSTDGCPLMPLDDYLRTMSLIADLLLHLYGERLFWHVGHLRLYGIV